MNFWHEHRIKIKITIIVSIILDVAIAIVVNEISSGKFDITAQHNIVMAVLLVVLILALIVTKIIESGVSTRARNKRLQKTFQDNGGYEAIAEEMKNCIKRHDLNGIKEIKKMVDIIER